MTIETCKRMMDNCIRNRDEKGAELYRLRILRKERKQGIKDSILGDPVVKEAEKKEDGKKR